VFLQREHAYMLSFIRDITERKDHEARIAKLLQEKEVLVREVQHRVKNNLNTMESLLAIQAEYATVPSAAMVLREAQTRLRSMGLLYDKLYRSESVSSLPVKTYLPALVDEIVAIFPETDQVRAETVTDGLVLPVKTLSTLGILMNELITNAMKHAFKGRKGGRIRVSALRSGTRAVFIVEDDGIGIPEGVDAGSTKGLGLKLVRLLAEQLSAEIRIERGQGSRVVVEFEIGEAG
jgi:two-component sensor histidine kinase